MDRRLALVAVWALFAAAAVGVGFGAAGLVGDPFTDSGVSTGPSQPSAATGTSSPAPTTSSAAPSTAASTARPATRSLTTRGGLVSGTCRDGLVRLSAAPAVGWEIDDIDDDAEHDAKVTFERVDGDGKVEVHAGCVSGVPRFSTKDDSSGSGGSDGSGDSGSGSGSGDSGDD